MQDLGPRRTPAGADRRRVGQSGNNRKYANSAGRLSYVSYKLSGGRGCDVTGRLIADREGEARAHERWWPATDDAGGRPRVQYPPQEARRTPQ